MVAAEVAVVCDVVFERAGSHLAGFESIFHVPSVKTGACIIRLEMIQFIRLSIFLAGLPAMPQSLDGVWQSQGYGNVYEIRGSTLKAFEVTTRTCVPGFTAKLLTIAIPGREATFKERGGDQFFIGSGSDSDHKTLNHPDGLSKIRIDRLPRMPAVCGPPTENTPLGNFEVFSRTFAEHYIAFDLKRIDWDKVVTDHRSKVTPQTTPAQLFDLFEAMIKPLADIHTGIQAPNLKREFDAPLRPGTDRVVKGGIDRFAAKGRRELFAVTDRTYLHGSLKKFCRNQVQYGHINDTTGYLRILSFGDYARVLCTGSFI